jgi:hypothetical protein
MHRIFHYIARESMEVRDLFAVLVLEAAAGVV